MLISASFLSIKNDLKKNIEILDNTTIDYLHLDIMDGLFVPNKTWTIDEISDLLENTSKPLDVHLMVIDIYKYIDLYAKLKPSYITFHYEATKDINNIIDYVHSKGIKVGISIKPSTEVNVLKPYLNNIDLVLIMGVEPGMGGQKVIPSTLKKVSELQKLKGKYIISIDGGMNIDTIKKVKADMYVIGSYITSSTNYQKKIDELK